MRIVIPYLACLHCFTAAISIAAEPPASATSGDALTGANGAFESAITSLDREIEKILPIKDRQRTAFISRLQEYLSGRKSTEQSESPWHGLPQQMPTLSIEETNNPQTVAVYDKMAAAIKARDAMKAAVVKAEQEMVATIRKEFGNAIRAGMSESDLGGLTKLVTSYETRFSRQRNGGYSSEIDSLNPSLCQRDIEVLRSLIAAEKTQNPEEMVEYYSSCSDMLSRYRLRRSDLEARRATIVKPWRDDLAKARAVFTAAVIAGEPAKSLIEKHSSITSLTSKISRIATNENRFGSDLRWEKSAIDIQAQIDLGKHSAAAAAIRGFLQSSRTISSGPDGTPIEVFAKMEETEKAISRKLAEEDEELAKGIEARIRKVAKPEELAPIVADLSKMSPSSSYDSSSSRSGYVELGRELSRMAGGTSATISAASQAYLARWTKVLEELRERFRRRALSQDGAFKELAEERFAQLSLPEAIRKLRLELGASGQWRRAFDLVVRTEDIAAPDAAKRSDETAAVKQYLVGLQYEEAEQYEWAVSAYQTVISAIGESIPLKEAGARLKELKAKHPEAFQASPVVKPEKSTRTGP